MGKSEVFLRKILLPLLSIFLLAYPDQADLTKKTILRLFTVPKCGTQLTKRILGRLISQDRINNFDFFDCHLGPQTDQYLNMPNCKVVIVIRDFRDAIVSSRHWKLRQGEGVVNGNLFEETIDNQLKLIVTDPNDSIGFLGTIKRAMRWLDCPHACIVRFEEIIGENGGGSRELQIATFQKILDYLELDPPEGGVEAIADTIHGIENIANPTIHGPLKFAQTWRKGVIGEWRKEFSEDVKECFKEHLGWALIKAGYEKDMSW